MKKLLIGAAVGIGVSYALYKLYEQGKFDGLCEDANRLALKAKKDFKNAVDTGKNQAEYLKDRISQEVQNGKEKLAGLDK
mgnify:CR=1 FL=1